MYVCIYVCVFHINTDVFDTGTGKDFNVYFKRAWIGGTMHVICQTLHDIQKDEEMLVEYGQNYWENIHDDTAAIDDSEESKENANDNSNANDGQAH